jgi:hypothetical protein
MLPARISARPTLGQLAMAQTFRFLTMLATWTLIFAAFVYEPGWIRDSLRSGPFGQVARGSGSRALGRAAGDNVTRVGRIDLDSDRLCDRLAAADHLGAIPYLATAQRTPTSLPGGLTRSHRHGTFSGGEHALRAGAPTAFRAAMISLGRSLLFL